jgi:hypothetical protein
MIPSRKRRAKKSTVLAAAPEPITLIAGGNLELIGGGNITLQN